MSWAPLKTLELNDNKTFLSLWWIYLLNMQTILKAFQLHYYRKKNLFVPAIFLLNCFWPNWKKIGVLGSFYRIVGLWKVRKKQTFRESVFNGFYFPIARLQCDWKDLFLLQGVLVKLCSRFWIRFLKSSFSFWIITLFEIQIIWKLLFSFRFRFNFNFRFIFNYRLKFRFRFRFSFNFGFKFNFRFRFNFIFSFNFRLSLNFRLSFRFNFNFNFRFLF